ncbi:nucleotidyltransferase substrate binding protein [Magnetococcales bacterium HHB-1]
MTLDLSRFKKALSALERSVGAALSSERMQDLDEDIQEAVRAGVIQSFEFTYEQCWKLMRRWLKNNVGPTHVDGITRRQLFRLSAEHRLIDDVDQWMDFHDNRNRTSHTYNEDTAVEVFRSATAFTHAAKQFLAAIEARND